MKPGQTNTRHWTEKAHPALLAILNRNKASVVEARQKPPTQRRFLQQLIAGLNFFLWPFDFGRVPEPASNRDTIEELRRKTEKLWPKVEETTDEYLMVTYGGRLLPWSGPLSQCPITIEAEQKFWQRLNELAKGYIKTRPSRRAAVLRKISHAITAWWGITYGAWPGTENHWTPETLSWEEAADLYDALCFATCKGHTPEEVRKLTTRLVHEIKDVLPPTTFERAQTAS